MYLGKKGIEGENLEKGREGRLVGMYMKEKSIFNKNQQEKKKQS